MAEAPLEPRTARLGDMLAELEETARGRFDAFKAGIPLGPKSGFAHLDKVIGGWFSPGLHTLHGKSGDGKSALALQLAATCGTPALLISCEMDPIDLLLRHTARITKTLLTKLKGGNPPMDPDELIREVRQAAATAPDLWLMDARTIHPSMDQIRDAAVTARDAGRHVLVVIDSLHAWAGGMPEALGEYENLNRAIAGCLGLAANLKAPVLIVAERNRQSAARGGLDGAAGSRKFEYSAETVLDLRRADDKESGEDPTPMAVRPRPKVAEGVRQMELILRKNRHGKEGERITLDYNPAVMEFTDPTAAKFGEENGHAGAAKAEGKWF